MTNGNTGVSDVIIGNHHCRLLWDALQSKEEMIIRETFVTLVRKQSTL